MAPSSNSLWNHKEWCVKPSTSIATSLVLHSPTSLSTRLTMKLCGTEGPEVEKLRRCLWTGCRTQGFLVSQDHLSIILLSFRCCLCKYLEENLPNEGNSCTCHELSSSFVVLPISAIVSLMALSTVLPENSSSDLPEKDCQKSAHQTCQRKIIRNQLSRECLLV